MSSSSSFAPFFSFTPFPFVPFEYYEHDIPSSLFIIALSIREILYVRRSFMADFLRAENIINTIKKSFP